ncbi:MAG: peroxidase-related enzyme [bacterium]|nr:peroxidase-related enzyme [bacterium]
MGRMKAVDTNQATGKQKELLEAVKAKMGKVPNMLATLANSPASLQAYLGFSGALAGGVLSARLREQIACALGELNGCDYCVAAHSIIGKGAGLDPQEITAARKGESADPKARAALRFARAIVEHRGHVADADLSAVREAGFGDAEITEIVTNVGFNIFTNYFNHVADPVIDFPRVEPLGTAGGACGCPTSAVGACS